MMTMKKRRMSCNAKVPFLCTSRWRVGVGLGQSKIVLGNYVQGDTGCAKINGITLFLESVITRKILALTILDMLHCIFTLNPPPLTSM